MELYLTGIGKTFYRFVLSLRVPVGRRQVTAVLTIVVVRTVLNL